MPRTYLARLLGLLLALSNQPAPAASTVTGSTSTPQTQAFISGSYKQILANNTKQPFLLAIWSINCVSCMKDMALLRDIHKQKPALKIILLAADDLSASAQIHGIFEKLQLTDLENWVFADDNDRKLRFEIDPKWYGEIPRTYFFDAAQQRTGVSGVLPKAKYDAMIGKILN
ncbi:TlpA family protein disulfide reductase [Methylovulum miyakonense]|uniref:TlpA family protein disulfide reductase n=1 Tax=Methylovulum miyakonense TaxID=645578 RepID=UPI00037094D7|nr:hypothetical protein [Methylovulum miyakonense]